MTLVGCATPRYRYDRHKDSDGIEAKELEQLIADGAGPSPGTVAAGLKVEQVSYDFAAEVDEYRLGKNDVLNIYVMDHPEMSSQRINLGEISGTTVKKDGNVYLPVIGSLKAEGLTVVEFQQALTEEAAKYIHGPQVTVDVMRYESQKFFVLGQVQRPGAFPVDGDTTLLEAVGLAGGVLETGNYETATVVRAGKILPISIGDLMLRGDTSRNVHMRAGDLIFVPDNSQEKVYVLGEVTTPTVVPIQRNRVTLAEALAVAGGPTPGRARRELAVIRGGFAKPIVYTVDLDRALLVDEQILLRPGDRVVVAPTGLSRANRWMTQILPFLVGAQALGIAAQGATSLVNQATAAAGN